MSDQVGELSAISFASGFYQALAWGKSVQQAFMLGKNQMALEGFDDSDVPILKTGGGVDASNLYLTGDGLSNGTDDLQDRIRQLCLSLCNRWGRFHHVAFRVDEAKSVMASSSTILFEFAEAETEMPAQFACAIQAIASELKALSEKRVKHATTLNMKTGEVDDNEERQFRSDGDAVFQRLNDLA